MAGVIMLRVEFRLVETSWIRGTALQFFSVSWTVLKMSNQFAAFCQDSLQTTVTDWRGNRSLYIVRNARHVFIRHKSATIFCALCTSVKCWAHVSAKRRSPVCWTVKANSCNIQSLSIWCAVTPRSFLLLTDVQWSPVNATACAVFRSSSLLAFSVSYRSCMHYQLFPATVMCVMDQQLPNEERPLDPHLQRCSVVCSQLPPISPPLPTAVVYLASSSGRQRLTRSALELLWICCLLLAWTALPGCFACKW